MNIVQRAVLWCAHTLPFLPIVAVTDLNIVEPNSGAMTFLKYDSPGGPSGPGMVEPSCRSNIPVTAKKQLGRCFQVVVGSILTCQILLFSRSLLSATGCFEYHESSTST